MKKVLITGVAGFIGSKVATRFINEGYTVVGVDDLSSGRIENVPEGLLFIQGDLSKQSTISKLPIDCSQILHLAGQSSGEISFDDSVADLEKNTVTTLNLIKYGIDNSITRIIYASSMSVYGAVPDQPIDEKYQANPLSCYGVGKLAAEGYLRVYQKRLPFLAMRMFNVYGPGQDMANLRQGMVSIYLAQALKEKHIIVKGSTDRFRDFIYIDDVVNAWFRASMISDPLNRAINIGTGQRTSIMQILNMVSTLLDGISIEVQGGTLGDQTGIYADNCLMKGILGIDKFTPLNMGLKIFTEWALSNAASTKSPASQTA